MSSRSTITGTIALAITLAFATIAFTLVYTVSPGGWTGLLLSLLAFWLSILVAIVSSLATTLIRHTFTWRQTMAALATLAALIATHATAIVTLNDAVPSQYLYGAIALTALALHYLIPSVYTAATS